jgi:ribonucleoside-diphosphate reductase alpha chain
MWWCPNTFVNALGSSQREHNVKQLISRVVDTITNWGRKDSYFVTEDDAQTLSTDELTTPPRSKLAFNSPVWFNVGVEDHPQCSACFILSVEDRMESILDWYRKEGIIFKGGSGSGVNLSKIRSSKERLAGGGTASGPVSFMRAADASAGVIKSGGKTRRAAKMVVLDIDHPDIMEFIQCKVEEEKKAWTLIEAGYDASIDGAAQLHFFQNANNSVRVTDDFTGVLENKSWSIAMSQPVKSAKPCQRAICCTSSRKPPGSATRHAVRYDYQLVAYLLEPARALTPQPLQRVRIWTIAHVTSPHSI